MTDLIGDSLWQRRLWGVTFAVFAGLALTLAAVGIFGVLSYSVSRRTRELGIRLALGAHRRNVLWLVVRQGMALALLGLATGVGAALVLGRMLSSLLFGTTGHDPAVFGGVCLLLVVVALLACYLPARRATRVDPLEALRVD
jgi:ABC-type antimicrobial peptide transport system permease subunit